MQQQHNRGIVEVNALQNYLVTTKLSLFEQLYIILYKLQTNTGKIVAGRQFVNCVLHVGCKIIMPAILRTRFQRQI